MTTLTHLAMLECPHCHQTGWLNIPETTNATMTCSCNHTAPLKDFLAVITYGPTADAQERALKLAAGLATRVRYSRKD